MSPVGNSENCALLRNLLTSWDLAELYEHLRDEEINMEELEMMKLHHINELLRNFKLGVRIRFEYHFEKWRHSIFKPLSYNYEYSKSYEPINNNCENLRTHEPMNNNCENLEIFEPIITKIEPQNIIPANEEINREQSPILQSKDNESKSPELNNHQPSTEEIVEPRISINTNKRKATEHDENADTQINVLKILKSFGRQGTLLLNAYKKNKFFKPPDRHQLITLIVEYFIINNHHLSLNTSYNLENQILKYFPTEKLEHYRTDKRGKIYSKFGNMKRKFKGNNDSINISLDVSNTTPIVENEMDVDTDGNEQVFCNIPVKIECIIDE